MDVKRRFRRLWMPIAAPAVLWNVDGVFWLSDPATGIIQNSRERAAGTDGLGSSVVVNRSSQRIK